MISFLHPFNGLPARESSRRNRNNLGAHTRNCVHFPVLRFIRTVYLRIVWTVHNRITVLSPSLIPVIIHMSSPLFFPFTPSSLSSLLVQRSSVYRPRNGGTE
jgi:hypothetical protein